MTVGELIEALKQASPDALVVVPRDPEGNGFSELCDVGKGKWDQRHRELFDHKDEGADDLPLCVVLWPA